MSDQACFRTKEFIPIGYKKGTVIAEFLTEAINDAFETKESEYFYIKYFEGIPYFIQGEWSYDINPYPLEPQVAWFEITKLCKKQ